MLKIAIIGDLDGRPSLVATDSSLIHSTHCLGLEVQSEWISTPALLENALILFGYDGIFCSPGSPYKSMQGAINGISYARTNKIPFMGTCGGFQHAILEFARNVLNIKGATHAEGDGESEQSLTAPLACSLSGIETNISLKSDSLAFKLYQKAKIGEKFRCSYGIGTNSLGLFENSQLYFSGVDDNQQVVMAELQEHPFFIMTLFQPQLSSTADNAHPIISAFLNAAFNHKIAKDGPEILTPLDREWI